MKKPALFAVIGFVAVLASLAGYYLANTRTVITQANPESLAIAQKLAQLTLITPEGKPVQLANWANKIRVINFWATWCPPCREEMPAFSRTQSKLTTKEVQFVGIGIDNPESIIEFAKKTPVSYPLLVGTYDTLKLTADLGNKQMGLPFTVILDANGGVAFVKLGQLSESELEQHISPLLTGR